MPYDLQVIFYLENIQPGINNRRRIHETLGRPLLKVLSGNMLGSDTRDRYFDVQIEPETLKERLETVFEEANSQVDVEIDTEDPENVRLFLIGDEPTLHTFELEV